MASTARILTGVAAQTLTVLPAAAYSLQGSTGGAGPAPRTRELQAMNELLVELERRWRRMFGMLAQGGDVPPSLRLRAEGMMEAAALLGIATEEALGSAMDACYRRAWGRALAEDFGEDWREFYPFPQIPAVGRRAPVWPSTSDTGTTD
jgi:hypothetical protein